MGVLGDFVPTTAGGWITHPPTRCPNGNPLGPTQVLVGHQACLGHGGGVHDMLGGVEVLERGVTDREEAALG
jgi:hypothetical protein